MQGLAGKYGVGDIWIKDESHRFGLKSFKSLGVHYAVEMTLKQEKYVYELCTATDGNHGIAVARVARKRGLKCTVFVPEFTTRNRIEAIKKEGAEVFISRGNYEHACHEAIKWSIKNSRLLIQDNSSDNYIRIPAYIMAGYTTLLREMEDTLHLLPEPQIDYVFIQAGVGSMAGATIWYYLNRYGAKRPKLIIIEPEEADGILESFRHDELRLSKGNSNTIMAGLNCGLPSPGAWEIIKNGADASLGISDKFTIMAMRALYYPTYPDIRITSGESGSAGLAGFIALMTESKFRPLRKHLGINDQSRILLINTEGDTDPDIFRSIVGK